MEEKIRELKQVIISGYTYADIELETHDIGDIQYRCENLMLEYGKVIYACREFHKDGTEHEGATIIYDNTAAFLKAKITDIINIIHSAYYYNVRRYSEYESELLLDGDE